ncbi:MAG: LamG-like jellyroll fold domain-containing protein [Thermoplasmatota archaeon]
MNDTWKNKRKLKNDGVSEIIGTVVLLAVAVASFSVLYVTLSATLVSEESPQVNVIGYIEGDSIVLEHQGGDTLKDNTKIDFTIGGRSQSFSLTSSNDNFTFYDSNNNGEWDVGEKVTYSSPGSFSGLAVDTSVIDTSSNSALFIGSLQDGDRNATPVVDLSTVVEMLPFTIDSSPYQIDATGSSQLDSVTLYYAFSSSNWTGCSNQTLSYDDFEDGFGKYISGGSDCDIYSGGVYAHQGNNASHIQNSGDNASFYLNESIDIDSPGYSTIIIDFWFYPVSMHPDREFLVEFYDGSEWQTVRTYKYGTDFENNNFYHKLLWINESGDTFPSNMNIRFKGAMENKNDDLYFDQIYINATCTDGSSSSEPVWMQYATDMNSPWSWDFSFPNGTGYYQFYSIGEYDGNVEAAPSTADAFCYYNATTASDEISIWHFDEDSGGIAFDSSDGNDGTIHGATWTTGVQNSALSFDGDNDYVYVADSENLNFKGNFTAMAWVKWTIDPETGDSWANILNKGRDAQWQIQHSYDNSQFEFAVNTENTRHWADSSTEVKEGVWYHVAGIYDGSEIRIYVNGSYENQYDLTGDVFVTDYPVNIGRRSVFNDRYFTGIIDEVYLYNRTLSAEELLNYYNQTKPDMLELVSSWEFNEDAGSIAYDSSDGNDGTIHGATWTTGVSGTALFFDNQAGQDEYVSIPDDDNLDLTTEGSVEAWIKINSYQDYAGIVHKGNQNDFSDEAYTLQFWDNGRTILFGGNDDSGDSITIESSEELNLDQWYHIVGTWDASSIKLYINGDLEVDETFSIDAIRNTDGSLQIGAQLTENYSGHGYFGFDGIIDQVALYNTALTADEIVNHYNEYQP